VGVHPRFRPRVWDRLRSFALEVDPGFSALSVDSLLLHMLGDVFTYSHSLTKLKVPVVLPSFQGFGSIFI
jgi:hypothetical protein